MMGEFFREGKSFFCPPRYFLSPGIIKSFYNEIGCKFYLGIGRPLPDNLQDFTFQQENIQASRNYVPQVYPGRVTLFRCREQIIGISSYSDPHLGWGELAAGGLECHEVPGTHLGMLQEPHVQVLAKKMKACLDKAQAETHLCSVAYCWNHCWNTR
jgi:aspartate racemase